MDKHHLIVLKFPFFIFKILISLSCSHFTEMKRGFPKYEILID